MVTHGFLPDEQSYVHLILGAGLAKDAARARRFYLEMRGRLLTPTERVYCINRLCLGFPERFIALHFGI